MLYNGEESRARVWWGKRRISSNLLLLSDMERGKVGWWLLTIWCIFRSPLLNKKKNNKCKCANRTEEKGSRWLSQKFGWSYPIPHALCLNFEGCALTIDSGPSPSHENSKTRPFCVFLFFFFQGRGMWTRKLILGPMYALPCLSQRHRRVVINVLYREVGVVK